MSLGDGGLDASAKETSTAESSVNANTGAPVVSINGPGQISTPLLIGGISVLIIFVGVVFYAIRRK